MLPSPPPYSVQSHATFYTTSSGERICFRSLLEARWAWAFERLGFEWAYEPRTFLLPSGAVYTPDFYLETVGWIEIKPTLAALKDVEPKLREFTEHLPNVIPNEYVRRFYSITAEHPRLYPLPHEPRSPLIEWVPDGFRAGNLAYALAELCPPPAQWFREQHPGSYSRHMDHVLNLAAQQDFDDPLLVSEVVRGLLMRDGGLENLLWQQRPYVAPSASAPSRPTSSSHSAHGPGERAEDRAKY